jgi:hypothetical protein
MASDDAGGMGAAGLWMPGLWVGTLIEVKFNTGWELAARHDI